MRSRDQTCGLWLHPASANLEFSHGGNFGAAEVVAHDASHVAKTITDHHLWNRTLVERGIELNLYPLWVLPTAVVPAGLQEYAASVSPARRCDKGTGIRQDD
jgi:hypothetical protein